MKKIISIIGLVFQLAFITTTKAQIFWIGEPGDLNQLRVEKGPNLSLSPIYSDSNQTETETFEAKWSRTDKALFFIGGNIDPEGIGIVLEIASGPQGNPLVPGHYEDTGWGSSGPTLWLAVPPQYGDYGNMSIEPWMRNSSVNVREVEYKDQVLEKFAADFFIGGKGPDPTWIWGQVRYNSDFPVLETRAVPEPKTYALVAGFGLIGFGVMRRRIKS